MTEKKIKREVYTRRIGPLLNRVLNDQIESIKEVMHGTYKGSYYNAGEIVAKKYLGID